MELISKSKLDEVKRAASALMDGHLVAFPTETVYGLGADATNEKAVGRIYSVKGRPTDHPLIVHISSMQYIEKWAREIPDYAITLARQFWPGPITLVLKRSNLAMNFITGGQDTVGLRAPAHAIAQQLLYEFEKLGKTGIAAPSAHIFGAVSATSGGDVSDELGSLLLPNDVVLNGGRSLVGIESTIVDCTKKHPLILRPGSVTPSMIEEVVEMHLSSAKMKSTVRASGSMKIHYAPIATVSLTGKVMKGDGFIALSEVPTPKGAIRLAAPHTIEDFANILYQAFRSADKRNIQRIRVVPPKGSGLAVAIRDRLNKAAQLE
jgi:L-threonylcarbamoyladenylate synthase